MTMSQTCADNRLIRRSYWLDMDDRTLVMVRPKASEQT